MPAQSTRSPEGHDDMMRGRRASFVLSRMGSSWLLLGSVLLATLVAAALTATLASFSARVLPQAVHRQIASAPDLSIVVSGTVGAAQAAADSGAIRASMGAAFGSVPVSIQSALWSDSLGLPAARRSKVIPLAEAAAPDHIFAHAILTTGTWPGPPQRAHPIPAALPVAVARQLRLAPGQVLALRDTETSAPVRFRLTGLFRPRDPASPYWGLDLTGISGVLVQSGFVTYGPLVVNPAAFGRGGLVVGGASWLALPSSPRIPPTEITALAGRISHAETNLRQDATLGGLQVTTGIPQLLTGIAANVVVARSLLIINELELLMLASAAIGLAARMLAGDRKEESALLSARGATRWQLAWLTAAEALILAAAAAGTGALLGARLAAPLASTGPLHAARLQVSGIDASVWWSAGAILALAVAIMLWPGLRPVTPGTARIRRGRQGRIAGAARAGADISIIVLALIAVVQLRRYSAAGRTAAGGIGIDPVLVAAPPAALAGAALIPLRLVPALARGIDRLTGRSRRLGAALASWEISRRPIRQSGPVLLVVLAVATGTLALAQHQSWRQTAQDQAAFTAGADVRVDMTAPLPLGRGSVIGHAPRVLDAMPVTSFDGGTGGEVVALDARRATATVLLRPDLSALPAAALWHRITPRRAAPGLTLPGRPARLEIIVALRVDGGPAVLGPLSGSVSIQDAAGVVYSVPTASLRADGRSHGLVAQLSGTRASYPLRLLGVSLSYQLPPFPAPPYATQKAMSAAHAAELRAAARRAALTISGLAVSPAAAGAFRGSFALGSALRSWHAAAASADLPSNPEAHGIAPVLTSWRAAASGTSTLRFGPGVGHLIQRQGNPPLPISGQLDLTAGSPTQVIPGIATRAFLKSTSTAPGATILVSAGPTQVPVHIVAAIQGFPTVTGSGGALIVDQEVIQALLASESAAPLPVTQWWLRTATAAAPPGLPPGSAVTDRARVAAALLGNPLSAAAQQAVIAIVAAAALLAVMGFSVSVAASVRERRTQSALLAALGVSRAARARQLCLEQLMLSAPAAAAGLLLGAGMARLLIPAVTLTASATRPFPPALVQVPLGWAAALALVITAVPVLAAAATVVYRPDPAAQLRAAEAA